MTQSEKRELASLPEYRALSDFERRKRQLRAIPLSVVPDGCGKGSQRAAANYGAVHHGESRISSPLGLSVFGSN